MESAGEKYTLSATLHLPEGKKGPFPVVILNHGSITPGETPGSLHQATGFFLEEGFAVLVPMRSGHGSSGGKNHEPTANVQGTYESGLLHAGRDLDAVIRYVKVTPALDSSRIIVGGRSRGGILSVNYAAKAWDPSIKGVINFAGTWWDCCAYLNAGTFKQAGIGKKVPNLWIYGIGDTLSSDPSRSKYFA
jgi:dienelactone hydrolase